MSKVPNKTKDDIITLLRSPKAHIECISYNEYCGKNTICYKVYSTQYQWLCDLMISPTQFGLIEYSLSFEKNKCVTQYIRKNAVLTAPWAKNMMEIFNEVRLRYIIQKSQNKTK